MIQKFEFKGLDMKGAYEITPSMPQTNVVAL